MSRALFDVTNKTKKQYKINIELTRVDNFATKTFLWGNRVFFYPFPYIFVLKYGSDTIKTKFSDVPRRDLSSDTEKSQKHY
jgi:hypothetical protein